MNSFLSDARISIFIPRVVTEKMFLRAYILLYDVSEELQKNRIPLVCQLKAADYRRGNDMVVWSGAYNFPNEVNV